MKLGLRSFGAIIVLGCSLSVIAAVLPIAAEGCTPAQTSFIGRVEQTVLADIVAGKDDVQIEQDVATVMGYGPDSGVLPSVVVAIVVDATQLLIDEGFIPASILAQTKTLHSREVDKLTVLTGGHS